MIGQNKIMKAASLINESLEEAVQGESLTDGEELFYELREKLMEAEASRLSGEKSFSSDEIEKRFRKQ